MSNQDFMAGADALGRLDALFRPQSVAIVGASSDPRKIGGRPLDYMLRHGYPGAVYPINPKADQVQDVRAYPEIGAVDGEIDLAIIAVPSPAVEAAVTACADKGVKAAVLFSSGFAEVGDDGQQQQDKLLEIARASGLRLLGPNCLGLFSIKERLGASFSTSLASMWPPAGDTAIVAQSGAFGSHVYVMARDRGLGLSYWCATGNEADVDVADCIAFCARDPSTRGILSYMEGCKDGDKLRAALELARQAGKPVVIMKVGSSDVGAEAAQSHTAALAGADRVYDAVFRQHGVYRAESINDMLDVAYACGAGRFPTGRRLAAVTISGGAGVLIADRAAKVGLEMPEMPEAAQRELKELISFSSPRNPVDVTAQALNDRSLLRRFVDVTLEQDCYDAVIVFLAMVGLFRPMMDEFHKMLDEMRRGAPDKLIALSMIVEEEDRKRAEEKGFPVFEEPSNAVDAVAALARFAEAFARPPMAAIEARPIELDRRPNEYQALRLLAGAGVGVVDARLATNADEAVAAATDLGGPVAMKICSADILHKSDIGGVRLGVSGADDVREAFDRIMAVARSASPSAMIDGVILQPMAARGVETIIGVQRDPVFGPVVMFGLGGILVEALEDVTFRVAPFDVAEARRMIDEIKGRKILDGVRGAPPADIDALAETLSRLSAVAAASAETIDSIDINPFVLGAKGEGGMALDAVILPRLNG